MKTLFTPVNFLLRSNLSILGYKNADTFDIYDEKKYKMTVVWLEKHKIQRYQSEKLLKFCDILDPEWEERFGEYLLELHCPTLFMKRLDGFTFLVNHAAMIQTRNQLRDEEFNRMPGLKKFVKKIQDEIRKEDGTFLFQEEDFDSQEFINGVHELAKVLNIATHPDHMVMFKGASKLIEERLSNEGLANPDSVVHKGEFIALFFVSALFKVYGNYESSTAKGQSSEKGKKKDEQSNSSDCSATTGDLVKVMRLLMYDEMKKFKKQVNEYEDNTK